MTGALYGGAPGPRSCGMNAFGANGIGPDVVMIVDMIGLDDWINGGAIVEYRVLTWG